MQNVDYLLNVGLNFLDNKFNKLDNIYDDIEYCSDSKNMNRRGYYCPSAIRDFWVSNSKRGHLTSKIPKKKYFKYYFKDNLLKKIEHFILSENPITEYLVWEDNICYGIEVRKCRFDDSFVLSSVSKEVYENGRIISFEIAYFSFTAKDRYTRGHYDRERYVYENNRIIEFETSTFIPLFSPFYTEKYKVIYENDNITDFERIDVSAEIVTYENTDFILHINKK